MVRATSESLSARLRSQARQSAAPSSSAPAHAADASEGAGVWGHAEGNGTSVLSELPQQQQPQRQDAKVTKHPCPRHIKPLLYFYKYLQPVLESGRKLKLNLPTPIVCERADGQEDALWLRTDALGFVVKEEHSAGVPWRKKLHCELVASAPMSGDQLHLPTSASDATDSNYDLVVAVRNVAHWRGGSNNKSVVLTRWTFETVVSAPSELAFSIQQFVRCRGSHASIYRVRWCDKETKCFAVNLVNDSMKTSDAQDIIAEDPAESDPAPPLVRAGSTASLPLPHEKSALDVAMHRLERLSHFYCVSSTTSDPKKCGRLPKIRGSPIAEGVSAARRIVEHVQAQLPGIRIPAMAADFIKDSSGTWWFIRVVSFDAFYRVPVPQEVMYLPESVTQVHELMRSKYFRQSLFTSSGALGLGSGSGSAPAEKNLNLTILECFLCGSLCEFSKQFTDELLVLLKDSDDSHGGVLKELAEYRMTLKMAVDTVYLLRQRAVLMPTWESAVVTLRRSPTQAAEFTVCLLCYRIYKQQQKLHDVALELHGVFNAVSGSVADQISESNMNSYVITDGRSTSDIFDLALLSKVGTPPAFAAKPMRAILDQIQQFQTESTKSKGSVATPAGGEPKLKRSATRRSSVTSARDSLLQFQRDFDGFTISAANLPRKGNTSSSSNGAAMTTDSASRRPILSGKPLAIAVTAARRIIYRIAGDVSVLPTFLLGMLLRSANFIVPKDGTGSGGGGGAGSVTLAWRTAAPFRFTRKYSADRIFGAVKLVCIPALVVLGELLLVMLKCQVTPSNIELRSLETLVEPFWLYESDPSSITRWKPVAKMSAHSPEQRMIWDRVIRRCESAGFHPTSFRARVTESPATNMQLDGTGDGDEIGFNGKPLSPMKAATALNAIPGECFRVKVQALVLCEIFEEMEVLGNGYIDIAEVRSLSKCLPQDLMTQFTIPKLLNPVDVRETLSAAELSSLSDALGTPQHVSFGAILTSLVQSQVLGDVLAEFDRIGCGEINFEEFWRLCESALRSSRNFFSPLHDEPRASGFCLRHGKTEIYAIDGICTECSNEYAEQVATSPKAHVEAALRETRSPSRNSQLTEFVNDAERRKREGSRQIQDVNTRESNRMNNQAKKKPHVTVKRRKNVNRAKRDAASLTPASGGGQKTLTTASSTSLSALLREELRVATRERATEAKRLQAASNSSTSSASQVLVDRVAKAEEKRKKLDRMVLAEIDDVKRRLARLMSEA